MSDEETTATTAAAIVEHEEELARLREDDAILRSQLRTARDTLEAEDLRAARGEIPSTSLAKHEARITELERELRVNRAAIAEEERRRPALDGRHEAAVQRERDAQISDLRGQQSDAHRAFLDAAIELQHKIEACIDVDGRLRMLGVHAYTEYGYLLGTLGQMVKEIADASPGLGVRVDRDAQMWALQHVAPGQATTATAAATEQVDEELEAQLPEYLRRERATARKAIAANREISTANEFLAGRPR